MCKKKLGILKERADKKWILENDGIPPEGMNDDDVLCNECLKPIGKAKREAEKYQTSNVSHQKKEKPTRLLYLVPIFMGLLGGVLMYIAVKDQNQEMANDGMFWGVISTIVAVFIYGFIMWIGYGEMSRMMIRF